MNREIPIANRFLHRKQTQRSNDLLLSKIANMKFANFSSFRGKNEIKSVYKSKQLEPIKLNPLDLRSKRVKTVMNDERIREENRNLCTRLAHQKPTVSTKLFTEDRHKNIELLRRIGRYPYKQSNTAAVGISLDAEQQSPIAGRSRTMQDMEEEVEGGRSKIKKHLSSVDILKNYHITERIEEEQRKEYVILLCNQVMELQKSWYTVKFLRLKNHYQIEVSPYPSHTSEYTLKLSEQVGTSMLSEHDYDYEYIITHFTKMTHQILCLSFQLSNGTERKKHFYKFQQKAVRSESEYASNRQNSLHGNPPPYRKTKFALQKGISLDLKPQYLPKQKLPKHSPQIDRSQPHFKDIWQNFSVSQLPKI